MNRLTKIVNGTAVLDATAFPDRAQETLDREMNAFPPFCEVVKRLAEYEGLEEQGRLIKHPCKPGDTVYIKGEEFEVSFIYIDKNGAVYAIEIDCCDKCMCALYEDYINHEGEHDCKTNGYFEFKDSDIGKTIFLTKAEAEAALKGVNNDQS